MLARLIRKTTGLLLLAVLLVPGLSRPGLADEASLLAKVGGVPAFRISVCFIDQVPFATIQTRSGRPVCGPVPVTVFPVERRAFFSCQVGSRIISVSIVAQRGVAVFTAADNRGNSALGLLCLE